MQSLRRSRHGIGWLIIGSMRRRRRVSWRTDQRTERANVHSALAPTAVLSRHVPVSSSLPAPAGVRGGHGIPSVPRDLWWAGGYEALKQDWTSGDFSTWIDRKVHLQAFGVRFALDGLLDMVSHDQRPAIARRLSVVGGDDWLSTPEAIDLVKGAIGDRDPKQFIVEQARLGFIAGRAIEAQRFEERPHTELIWEEREWDVPSWLWENAGWLLGHEDWDTGRFGAREPETIGSGWMRVSGVHFLTESLEALLPSRATSVASEAVDHEAPDRSRPGGRLPADLVGRHVVRCLGTDLPRRSQASEPGRCRARHAGVGREATANRWPRQPRGPRRASCSRLYRRRLQTSSVRFVAFSSLFHPTFDGARPPCFARIRWHPPAVRRRSWIMEPLAISINDTAKDARALAGRRSTR